MARYDVTYKCGHSGSVDLWGKGADREREIYGMGYKLCPDCYGVAKATEIAATNEGMVALTGSDKQIAWALEIRGQWIKSVDQRLVDVARVHGADRASARRTEIMGLANSVTVAHWWIEQRGNLDKAIVDIRRATAHPRR